MQLTWCYALCLLSHSKIISALNLFIVDAGAVAHCIYTDFDPKILEGATAKWIVERCHKLHASPSDCQLQNGLIEHTWQMAMGMVIAHLYMMDMQMPCMLWFWALWHAIQVMNYMPCSMEGVVTSPFELVHGIKPDY